MQKRPENIRSPSSPWEPQKGKRAIELLIVAGEASGDTLGGRLAQALGDRTDGLRLSGVGGPAMRSAGVETWFDAGDLEVVGIVEVGRRLRTLRRVKERILREVESGRFDGAILIDYPGFNLHLAERLHERGMKVCYFVAPQLWAWGRWRAPRLSRSVDRLLVILPFEPKIFRAWNIEATFVGHPLADAWKNEGVEGAQDKSACASGQGKPLIAILPGSREKEIAYLLPPMLEAARILKASYPQAGFVLPIADTLPWDDIARRAEGAGVLPVRGARAHLRRSDAAMLASGTATLEAALAGTPSVLAYRLHPLTFSLAHLLIQPAPGLSLHIGLVNLLAGETLFPELIQDQVTSENLAFEVKRILEDDARRTYVHRRLEDVRRSLGGKGCFDRAADAILETVRG